MIEVDNCDLKEILFIDTPISIDIPQMQRLYRSLFKKGKYFRVAMTYQVSSCLNIDKKIKNSLSRSIEYIHQSSILHDDVIDVSPVRRGGVSSWMEHSMKKSILAGDYLLAQVSSDIAQIENIPLIKITSDVLKKMVRGEWIQDSIKNKENILELNKVHELKTASLFQWSLRAPFLVIDRYEERLHNSLNRIGLMMGVLFQRADDLLDFDIRNYENKSTFQDMSAGHFNSFAIFLLKDKNFKLKKILKTCRDLKEVKQCIGEELFDQILQQFDGENKKKIIECQKEILELKKFLLKSEMSLIQELKNWSSLFYWRRNV